MYLLFSYRSKISRIIEVYDPIFIAESNLVRVWIRLNNTYRCVRYRESVEQSITISRPGVGHAFIACRDNLSFIKTHPTIKNRSSHSLRFMDKFLSCYIHKPYLPITQSDDQNPF